MNPEAKKPMTNKRKGRTRTLMSLLMEADGVALFIPLRREYIDQCLEMVPRGMVADPGQIRCSGTGATPPHFSKPSR